MGALNTGDDFT